MSRAALLALVVGCGGPSPPASKTPTPAEAPSAQPSENEQLYAKGAELEKDGRWEDAANVYQKYVFAMGDALTTIDRSSMELRIKQLREKAATSRSAQ
jgi:hypothetical protein